MPGGRSNENLPLSLVVVLLVSLVAMLLEGPGPAPVAAGPQADVRVEARP